MRQRANWRRQSDKYKLPRGVACGGKCSQDEFLSRRCCTALQSAARALIDAVLKLLLIAQRLGWTCVSWTVRFRCVRNFCASWARSETRRMTKNRFMNRKRRDRETQCRCGVFWQETVHQEELAVLTAELLGTLQETARRRHRTGMRKRRGGRKGGELAGFR